MTSPTDNQDGAGRAAGMHRQCDQSLNISAGVWPEHSTCIVSPDLAQGSATSSFYLAIMGCAGTELVKGVEGVYVLCQLEAAVFVLTNRAGL